MEFSKRIGKLSPGGIFTLDGYYVWCGTMTRDADGLYYLFFSFWEKELGFDAWVTHSKIGYAVGKDPFGKFDYQGIAFGGRGFGWDRDCVHNPSVIRHNGKYYMYYMGNYGNGEYWDHRNHQRVGVAVAERPEGPWQRFDKPAIDISPSGHDSLMTSNPAMAVTDDGRFVMIYKAVENCGVLPKGGPVVCGIATSDSPIGPFVKREKPIMVNPENDWSVEDAFIWYENGKFYSLAKDFQGYFTKAGKKQVALFESDDGLDWRLSDNPVGYLRGLTLESGEKIELSNMERPQIYIEDGKPFALLCACMREEHYEALSHSFNVRLKLD
jgi:hypothetical protein